MNNQHVAVLLATWLTRAKDKLFDIVIAGKVFGGRPGEAPQTPREFTLTGDGFVIHFGGGHSVTITDATGRTGPTIQVGGTETLTVIHPSGVSIGPAGELVVTSADEVRFGWHFYGRAQTEENWCVEAYKRKNTQVEYTVTGPITPYLRTTFPEVLPPPSGPFVLVTPA
jgi:hypothetical protein